VNRVACTNETTGKIVLLCVRLNLQSSKLTEAAVFSKPSESSNDSNSFGAEISMGLCNQELNYI
jgi:hypothetical protein